MSDHVGREPGPSPDTELTRLVEGAQTAARDQTVQGAREFAQAIVTFHSELWDSEMPEDLIGELTREWGFSLLPLRLQVEKD